MSNREKIRKEWNEAVDSWVDFVRKGKDYYRDELNNPATFELIGDVKDQLVLDLACGEGYNTRILARKGAKVSGIDFSERMIELARQEEEKEKLGISYFVVDATDLTKFASEHFNLVTCFMSLQDIENYQMAISEVARVLRSYGRFIFSIPHPCFSTITINGKRISTATRYFETVKDSIQWNMNRLLKPFRTTSFHRTLADYSNTLHKNNLLISRFVEPRPTQKGLAKHPPLKENLLTPQSIVIESVKAHKSGLQRTS